MIIYLENSTKISLNDSNYIGGGGQGKVYAKGSTAYKIYHDPQKMIDKAKIKELSLISNSNIYAPINLIYDNSNINIGFSMPYKSDLLFLCWLFNKGYKLQNSINESHINSLIIKMREILIYMHSNKFLVGDHNEMNILITPDFKEPIYIDTDSYQTPSFPCTAIMDTVRDRLVPFGQFSAKTDWFGYAIVTFQIYTGFHPYQCVNDSYSRRDVKALKMMDDNISIFHKTSKLPKNGIDLNIIPKNLRNWYKDVFENKIRTEPPIPNDITYLNVAPTNHIISSNTIEITNILSLNSTIKDMIIIDNNIFCITKNDIFKNGKHFCNIIQNQKYGILQVLHSSEIIIAKQENSIVSFYNELGIKISEIKNDKDMISFNNCIYTTNDGKLICNIFAKTINTTYHDAKFIGNINKSNYNIWSGLITQSCNNTIWLILFTDIFKTLEINIPELNNHRIIQAKYNQSSTLKVACLITEFKNKYYKNLIQFSKHNIYSFLSEECLSNENASLTILNNNIGITLLSDEKIELFLNINHKQIILDPPIDSSLKLFNDGVRLLAINNNNVIQIKTI